MSCGSCGKSINTGSKLHARVLPRVVAPSNHSGTINRMASQSVAAARLAVCARCSHSFEQAADDGNRTLFCDAAGVSCQDKVRLRDEACPLGYWSRRDFEFGVAADPDSRAVGLRRATCPKCTLKHLAYAYVALSEYEHGYPDHILLAESALRQAGQTAVGKSAEGIRATLDNKARAVGHLVHAMEECPDRVLAKKIRSAYTAILDGDTAPDILSMLQELEETT